MFQWWSFDESPVSDEDDEEGEGRSIVSSLKASSTLKKKSSGSTRKAANKQSGETAGKK